MIRGRTTLRDTTTGRMKGADVSYSITVRDMDPRDKAWLKREAMRVGISIEEFVRRLIHENRSKTHQRLKPSDAFARHFGENHGVELPPPGRQEYRPQPFGREWTE